MEIIYKLVGKKENHFLLLNTILWAIIGFVMWLIVQIFCLNSVAWMFVFIGYHAFFPGFVGGYLYLCNK